MFSLNLASDGRILSVTLKEFSSYGTIVKTLPEGNVTDYKYINKQYVYDPLPKIIQQEPTSSLEERVSDIELALADIYGGNVQ